MDVDTQQMLDEGIALLRIGRNDEARDKLMQVINADERNELAWLYLSEAVHDDADRQVCLENVLAINPANQWAATELRTLTQRSAHEQQAISGAQAAVPGQEIAGEPPLREARYKSFMEMLDTWAEMFALPRQARLDEEHAYARWGLFVPGILLTGAIAYFSASLVGVGTQSLILGTRLDAVQLLPIACGGALGGAIFGLIGFLISSGIYYLAARLLGGRGDFVVQSYLLSLVYGPLGLIYAIIFPFTLLSAANPVLGLIPNLLMIPIGILGLIMFVRALKSAHGYGTGAALGTIFLPGLFFGCIAAMIAIALAGTLTTLPILNP
jgi:hypothetical protein